MPRAWCVYRAIQVSQPEALSAIRLGRLTGGGEFDPSQSALVESGSLAGWKEGTAAGAGEVMVDHALQNRYVVRSSTPCLLVIGEVYYPWWRVYIDDEPVELGRVNYTMLGVTVPPGSHVVRLSIAPVSVWIGGAISVTGLLLWSALVIPARLRFRPNTPR